MIINNFDDIKKILFFDSKKEFFYFVQIIIRKKDMPNKVSGDKTVIKTMYIDSMETLDKKTPMIIDLCDKTGARAYIHPMPKSYRDLTKQMLKILSDKIFADDFQSPQTVAEKAAGIIKGDFPRWVVDLDGIEESDIAAYENVINDVCEPTDKRNKVITRIKTKNGYHLITEPFNLSRFNGVLTFLEKGIPDVHKNNPTVLYVNDALHAK